MKRKRNRTPAEIRRIIYGDERQPGCRVNHFKRDKKRASEIRQKMEQKRAELEQEDLPNPFLQAAYAHLRRKQRGQKKDMKNVGN